MDANQKAIVEQAMRDYLRAVAEYKDEDNVPVALKTTRKLLMIIELLQAEIEQLKTEAETLRLVANKDPLTDFYAKEHEEANKPPHPPFVGKGGNIIRRK